MPERETWVEFFEQTPRPNARTRRWTVIGLSQGNPSLGEVKWFGRWRCYAFFPVPGSTFNASCLEDIAAFCAFETRNHRAIAKGHRHCFPTWDRVEQTAHLVDEHDARVVTADLVLDHALRHFQDEMPKSGKAGSSHG